MTPLPSDRPVSALRARMIEDMKVRGFSEKTRNDYIRNVRAFAAFVGRSPDILCEDGPQSFALRAGMFAVNPQGAWHRFQSSEGVTLMAAPREVRRPA
jgi:hypothetical protein